MKHLIFAVLVLAAVGCGCGDPQVQADVKKVNVNLTYKAEPDGSVCFDSEQTFLDACDAWVCQPVDSNTVYPAGGDMP